MARFRARQALRQTFRGKEMEARLNLSETLLSLALPGYSFRAYRVPFTFPVVFVLYVALLLVFFIQLGYPIASTCVGLLVALHSASIFFLARNAMGTWSVSQRLGASLFIFIATWGLIYVPAQTFLGRFVTPLRTGSGVFVVQTSISPKDIQRGDAIAYKVRAFAGDGYYVKAGFGMGRVRATAGDKIEFTPKQFRINGAAYPRHPMMPETGELIVPQMHWFVWPDFAMEQRGRAAQFQASDMLARLGMISEQDFTGRVFDQWFWRKQQIP